MRSRSAMALTAVPFACRSSLSNNNSSCSMKSRMAAAHSWEGWALSRRCCCSCQRNESNRHWTASLRTSEGSGLPSPAAWTARHGGFSKRTSKNVGFGVETPTVHDGVHRQLLGAAKEGSKLLSLLKGDLSSKRIRVYSLK